MSKKSKYAKVPLVTPEAKSIKAFNSTMILNSGLGEALFPAGFGQDNVAFGQQQVSKTATLYSNLRGYLVSNQRQYLSQAYAEIGLIQTLVNLPVDDAFRGGIGVKSEQLSEEEITKLESRVERENDIGNLIEGFYWNRLFGGAGIVILTDQDPTTPLDLTAITKDSKLEFKAADLWELFYDKINIEGFNPAIDDAKFEYYSYYGVKMHKSRVLKLKGITAPSFIRPRMRGWGMSIVETLVRSINQYIKGTTLIFELLDEAKLDVFSLKNLADTLIQQQGAQLVQQRVKLANAQKNFQSAIVLDGEDKYEQKEFQFTGIADIMKEIRMQVASDLRMPMTKLFGISASGFNSGEDDLENYIAMVESQVRQKAKFDVIRILELRCQQLFGFVPDDLKIEFQPLRIMSSTDEEAVKTAQYARLVTAQQAGLITTEQFINACNKADLLIVQLDNSDAALSDIDSAVEDIRDAANPEVPGANKSDTESAKGSKE